MKKMVVLFMAVMALCGGVAFAQRPMCVPNEPGSLLVYPLINNIGAQTIIEIVNRGGEDVWLQGIMVLTPTGAQGTFIKEDFFIHLTAKEPFFWNTSKAYARKDADEVITQLRGYAGMQGFCFVWAVDGKVTQQELDWNFLTGDALIYGKNLGFSYLAYPHQALAITADRVLNLDGVEYCTAPSTILTQGFAAGMVAGLKGTLAVCALDIDFVQSHQPEFDINVAVYNQDETYHSRHLHVYQFAQFDLAADLKLAINQIFTPKWQLTATGSQARTATQTGGAAQPMWAVFFQSVGALSWGDAVEQDPASGAATAVVLPPVPLAP